jgi:hypothetical protein
LTPGAFEGLWGRDELATEFRDGVCLVWVLGGRPESVGVRSGQAGDIAGSCFHDTAIDLGLGHSIASGTHGFVCLFDSDFTAPFLSFLLSRVSWSSSGDAVAERALPMAH